MPSKSKAQHNLMAMVAHDRKAAKRLGIPQSVGREFMKADKGKVKKMRRGGVPLPGDRYSNFGKGSHNLDRAAVQRGLTGLKVASNFLPGGLGKAAKVASLAPMVRDAIDTATAAPSMSPAPETLPIGNRKGGHIKSKKHSYASGGSVFRRDADGIASKGKTRGQVVKMREGGSVGSFRRDADGIASKGKTKGKMVKMAYGGKC